MYPPVTLIVMLELDCPEQMGRRRSTGSPEVNADSINIVVDGIALVPWNTNAPTNSPAGSEQQIQFQVKKTKK